MDNPNPITAELRNALQSIHLLVEFWRAGEKERAICLMGSVCDNHDRILKLVDKLADMEVRTNE